MAQSPNADASITGSIFNGRFWNDSSVQEKHSYIAGFYDSLYYLIDDMKLTQSAVKELDSAEKEFRSHMRVRELISAVDGFYSDPTSVSIPIPAMMSIACQKANGESPAATENALAYARRRYSK